MPPPFLTPNETPKNAVIHVVSLPCNRFTLQSLVSLVYDLKEPALLSGTGSWALYYHIPIRPCTRVLASAQPVILVGHMTKKHGNPLVTLTKAVTSLLIS